MATSELADILKKRRAKTNNYIHETTTSASGTTASKPTPLKRNTRSLLLKSNRSRSSLAKSPKPNRPPPHPPSSHKTKYSRHRRVFSAAIPAVSTKSSRRTKVASAEWPVMPKPKVSAFRHVRAHVTEPIEAWEQAKELQAKEKWISAWEKARPKDSMPERGPSFTLRTKSRANSSPARTMQELLDGDKRDQTIWDVLTDMVADFNPFSSEPPKDPLHSVQEENKDEPPVNVGHTDDDSNLTTPKSPKSPDVTSTSATSSGASSTASPRKSETWSTGSLFRDSSMRFMENLTNAMNPFLTFTNSKVEMDTDALDTGTTMLTTSVVRMIRTGIRTELQAHLQFCAEEFDDVDNRCSRDEITEATLEDKLKYQFFKTQDGIEEDFEFRTYSESIYCRLRHKFGISNAQFRKTLTESKLMGSISSGKSGAFFFFSSDRKFVLKKLTKSESKFLRQILPQYYQHMISNPHTLLPRFCGSYRIVMDDGAGCYFVVMNNVFNTKLEINKIFDLKGSTYGREASDEEKKNGKLFKDLDFSTHIYLGKSGKAKLEEQLDRDCEFLEKHEIMDYSFLLGIHHRKPDKFGKLRRPTNIEGVDSGRSQFQQYENGIEATTLAGDARCEVYFIGIIDTLQRYNVRKQLETAGKSVVLDANSISAIDPKAYKERFLSFIKSQIS